MKKTIKHILFVALLLVAVVLPMASCLGAGISTILYDYEDPKRHNTTEKYFNGTEVQAPADPVRDGFEFIGWYHKGEKVTFPFVVQSSITLEARYKAITYSINYHTDLGQMPTDCTTSYDVYDEVNIPSLMLDNYYFAGWYDNPEFSGSRIASIPKGSFGDKEFYARWIEGTESLNYELSEDGKSYTVTGYSGSDTEICIPDAIDSKPVIRIADNAFGYCSDITDVAISNNVAEIGASAFTYCTSLKSVVMPENLTKIDNSVFAVCTSLTDIKIPEAVECIGDFAFAYCSSLTEVYLYDNVTHVGSSAFQDCTSLDSVKLGKGVQSIGDFAFAYCGNLKKVSFRGDNVKVIGNSAFNSCTSLTTISTSRGLEEIGSYAFAGCSAMTGISFYSDCISFGVGAFCDCTSLKDIDLPNYTEIIEEMAFAGCTSIKRVTIPRTVTKLGSNAFMSCTSLTTILYEGTESEWNEIVATASHSYPDVTVYFYSKEKPETEGNYWGNMNNPNGYIW